MRRTGMLPVPPPHALAPPPAANHTARRQASNARTARACPTPRSRAPAWGSGGRVWCGGLKGGAVLSASERLPCMHVQRSGAVVHRRLWWWLRGAPPAGMRVRVARAARSSGLPHTVPHAVPAPWARHKAGWRRTHPVGGLRGMRHALRPPRWVRERCPMEAGARRLPAPPVCHHTAGTPGVGRCGDHTRTLLHCNSAIV